jgi:GNAT superfamily N-acetyltransferase
VIQFVIRQPDSNEIQELAKLTYEARQASTLFDAERSLESVLEVLVSAAEDEDNRMIIAYENGEIVGWTQVYVGFPTMMFIGGWCPVVRVGVEADPVVHGLIEKTKELLSAHEHTRLEIELSGITETTEPDMQTYARWYSECGFTLAATEVHMRAEVDNVDKFIPPGGYSIQYMQGLRNADLEGPFYSCFDNGQDELYLSLDRAQRAVTFRYFFDRKKPMIDDASLAVLCDNKVVAFIVAREKDGAADIGPVGVVPEHQGKGLAKVLMSYALDGLKENKIRLATLDASASNMLARALYEKYGFRVQHLKAFLVWKK